MNTENSDHDPDDDQSPDGNEKDMTQAMPEKTPTDAINESTSDMPDIESAIKPSMESSIGTSVETGNEILNDPYGEDVFEIGIPIGDAPAHVLLSDTDASEPAAPFEAEPIRDEEALKTSDADTASGTDLLLAIKAQMEGLSAAFDSKLKYDDHKNKIIDDLHQNLQQHREGLLKKYLHRIVMDVIKIVDDMRKLTAHYNQQSHSAETSVKLLKYIDNIASDLEDMFSWEGVVPFTCDGDVVDPARQRVLNKIETNDPEKDKTIAERLRPGYEWDGKIIRPEMVSAYIYQTNSPSGD
ncbi:MAG: nucleotide exchange factor GrpE [Desulfosalsimonadaceae bacterium]